MLLKIQDKIRAHNQYGLIISEEVETYTATPIYDFGMQNITTAFSIMQDLLDIIRNQQLTQSELRTLFSKETPNIGVIIKQAFNLPPTPLTILVDSLNSTKGRSKHIPSDRHILHSKPTIKYLSILNVYFMVNIFIRDHTRHTLNYKISLNDFMETISHDSIIQGVSFITQHSEVFLQLGLGIRWLLAQDIDKNGPRVRLRNRLEALMISCIINKENGINSDDSTLSLDGALVPNVNAILSSLTLYIKDPISKELGKLGSSNFIPNKKELERYRVELYIDKKKLILRCLPKGYDGRNLYDKGLPVELIEKIFSYLSLKDLSALSLTYKSFARLTLTNFISILDHEGVTEQATLYECVMQHYNNITNQTNILAKKIEAKYRGFPIDLPFFHSL